MLEGKLLTAFFSMNSMVIKCRLNKIVFAYSDEGLKVGQRRSKRQARYEPHKATCPASRSSKQVCCSNIKPEPVIQEKCSDSAGYECLPITKCDLKEPVAQAESESEVLDIRG